MRVRTFLAFFVDAGAVMLHKVGGFAESAVFVNREARCTSAIVVRDQSELAGFIQRDVAGSGAARSGLIQKGEFAGFSIDGEGARGAAFLSAEMIDFVHGVKIFSVGMDGEEGRILGFGGYAH